MKIIVTKTQAREYTTEIRAVLKNEPALDLLLHAWKQRIWVLLNYNSWANYLEREFEGINLNPHILERVEVVVSMRNAGMSERAIAIATGLSKGTIHNTLEKYDKPHTHAQNWAPDGHDISINNSKDSSVNTMNDTTVADSVVVKAPVVSSVMGLDGKTYDRHSVRHKIMREAVYQEPVVDYSKIPATSLGIDLMNQSYRNSNISNIAHFEKQAHIAIRKLAAVSLTHARRILEDALKSLGSTRAS